MSDARPIAVERRPIGEAPEAELALVHLHHGWADILMDDGEVLTFLADELRRALEDAPPLRAA